MYSLWDASWDEFKFRSHERQYSQNVKPLLIKPSHRNILGISCLSTSDLNSAILLYSLAWHGITLSSAVSIKWSYISRLFCLPTFLHLIVMNRACHLNTILNSAAGFLYVMMVMTSIWCLGVGGGIQTVRKKIRFLCLPLLHLGSYQSLLSWIYTILFLR